MQQNLSTIPRDYDGMYRSIGDLWRIQGEIRTQLTNFINASQTAHTCNQQYAQKNFTLLSSDIAEVRREQKANLKTFQERFQRGTLSLLWTIQTEPYWED